MAYVFGISGSSCSGKSRLAEDFCEHLVGWSQYKQSPHENPNKTWTYKLPYSLTVALIGNDSFFRGKTHLSPDHSESTKHEAILEKVRKAKAYPNVDVVVFEGFRGFVENLLVKEFDMMIWLKVDRDVALQRRLKRGKRSGASPGYREKCFDETVVPLHEQYAKDVQQRYANRMHCVYLRDDMSLLQQVNRILRCNPTRPQRGAARPVPWTFAQFGEIMDMAPTDRMKAVQEYDAQKQAVAEQYARFLSDYGAAHCRPQQMSDTDAKASRIFQQVLAFDRGPSVGPRDLDDCTEKLLDIVTEFGVYDGFEWKQVMEVVWEYFQRTTDLDKMEGKLRIALHADNDGVTMRMVKGCLGSDTEADAIVDPDDHHKEQWRGHGSHHQHTEAVATSCHMSPSCLLRDTMQIQIVTIGVVIMAMTMMAIGRLCDGGCGLPYCAPASSKCHSGMVGWKWK